MANHPNRNKLKASCAALASACQSALAYIEEQPGGAETPIYNTIGAAISRYYREHSAYSLDGRDGSERGTLTDVKV